VDHAAALATSGMGDAAQALQRRAIGAALLIVLLWGASFTIQKMAYAALGPGGFLFGRSLLMSACAVALLRWRGSPLLPVLNPREWRVLLGLTLLGPVLHIAVVTYGIHWSTPFSTALIMACGPVITLILLRVLHGTRLQRHQVLGVALALGGVLLFMSDKLLQTDWRASAGDLMLLGAGVLFSLYTIWITPLVTRHGGAEVMCWTTLLAAPLMLAASAPAAWQAPYASVGPLVWAAFVWSVVVAAFLGWILWAWVNSVRGVARTAPVLYLVPPVAGLVAWATVGESFGVLKCAGGALALAGVAWAQFAPRATARST
jgi:drug/metabolite transporter (DMT)-like permease